MSVNELYRIRGRQVAVARVHRSRRMSVRERLRKYYGNVEHVEGLENVGKRTPLDTMSTTKQFLLAVI